jgi:hypothetical protein
VDVCLLESTMNSASPPTVEDNQSRPSPDVVARRLERAGVLVHLPTNRIFELNETGIRVWELLAGGQDADRIVSRLVEEFDVDIERAAIEVNDLLTRFRDEGFLES